ncbi:MAG: hypothetical protein ABSG43_26150 [Solirubrobacteraceae bacterium]
MLYDGGWVLPAEIPLLRAKGAPAQEQVFYSFSSAGSTAQINADLTELKRALGAGAIASSQSYLTLEQETSKEQSVNTPFITTFAIIALVLAVLMVANVVAAAVIASYRRIGVLKSIGFTPGRGYLPHRLAARLPTTACHRRAGRPVFPSGPFGDHGAVDHGRADGGGDGDRAERLDPQAQPLRSPRTRPGTGHPTRSA